MEFWLHVYCPSDVSENAQKEIEKALNAATKRNAIANLEKDYDVRFYHYNGLPPAGPRMSVVAVSRRVRLEANPEEDKQILVRYWLEYSTEIMKRLIVIYKFWFG